MYETVADPDPEIREGGRGGGGWKAFHFFFHFGLKIRGAGPPGLSPGSTTLNVAWHHIHGIKRKSSVPGPYSQP